MIISHLTFMAICTAWHRRHQCAFDAANGAIIIGWTTALVFFAVERVYGLRSTSMDRHWLT
jgi:hypothetical protein